MDDTDPRRVLALRLRVLREEHWPGQRITQSHLAQAFGVTTPLISSWESQVSPRIPPQARLQAYAALFATVRSFDGDRFRRVRPEDMSDDERRAQGELMQELTQLRNSAIRVTAAREEKSHAGQGPLRFEDADVIRIVCSKWPSEMLDSMKPYTDIHDPDYIELLASSELDALFEILRQLSRDNPTSRVVPHIGRESMGQDDYSSHLVCLGGIDWNEATESTLNRIRIPVRQVADWKSESGPYFEVEDSGSKTQHRPVVRKNGSRGVLVEDVALFARAANPFNRERSITMFNGMYARGTYGAARALTDDNFRNRNAEYLRSRFGNSKSYCILMRVQVENDKALTPDWTSGDSTLFEWQE
jgi:transcriptional regulator with XRE-family HTH domain